MGHLDDLLALQDRDTRVDQLRYQRSHLPERTVVAQNQQKLAASKAAQGERLRRREALTARQTEIDEVVGQGDAKRADLQRKLRAGTVPRELQALQHELDALNERISAVEDDGLGVMEELESVEAGLVEGAREIEAIEGALADAARTLSTAEAAIDQQLGELREVRAALVGALPNELVTRYDQLRPRLCGTAVARLQGGICSGCNLKLSSIEVARIRELPPDALVECEQCGRLLVRA